MPGLNEQVSENNDLVAITINDLRSAYRSTKPGERLLLPTIQRSLVWDNKRIVDYWDTLYRGWFPGLMMVRRFTSGTDAYSAGGADSEAAKTADGDLELFDGQQRMAAILLGFGEGPLAKTHRLWFGIPKSGKEGKEKENRPAFRVSTTGQPFGYRMNEPNAKLEVGIRREALDAFIGEPAGLSPAERAKKHDIAFRSTTGKQLAAGQAWSWYPLADLVCNAGPVEGIADGELGKLRKVFSQIIAVNQRVQRRRGVRGILPTHRPRWRGPHGR